MNVFQFQLQNLLKALVNKARGRGYRVLYIQSPYWEVEVVDVNNDGEPYSRKIPAQYIYDVPIRFTHDDDALEVVCAGNCSIYAWFEDGIIHVATKGEPS